MSKLFKKEVPEDETPVEETPVTEEETKEEEPHDEEAKKKFHLPKWAKWAGLAAVGAGAIALIGKAFSSHNTPMYDEDDYEDSEEDSDSEGTQTDEGSAEE